MSEHMDTTPPPGPFSPGDRVVWRSAISKPLPGATRAPAPYARAGRVTDQQGTHVWVAYDDTREIVQLFAYGGDDQHVWAEADYLTLSEQAPKTFPSVASSEEQARSVRDMLAGFPASDGGPE